MRKLPLSKLGRGRARIHAEINARPPRISASLFLFFLLSSFILHPSYFVRAQSAAYAEIGIPDTSAFPKISAVLDVYDANGQFVSGLKPTDISVLEDGNPRPVQELTESPVSAQIVVAVNPGPALDVRDNLGITRYQRLQQALGTWAQARQQAQEADDLSLVIIAGPLIAHTTPEAWLASFAAFQPDFRATTPNIQSLANALDAALAPTPQVGMKRAILFITPHMEDPNLDAALANIGQRALDSRTRIIIWFADGEQFFAHPSALLFQTLAAQTGGAYLTFSGTETLPDPETYFATLRRVYRLTYASSLTLSGEHTLSADVTLSGTHVVSAPQTFLLDIQPPSPIFVALPAQVARGAPESDPYNTEVLVPEEQPLEVVFDFPDGHPRPIVRAVLFVDGELAAENTSAPFDRFTWDIRAYTVSGAHELKVEATDSLGLTGASLGTSVQVNVTKPQTGLLYFLARYRYLIVWVVVGLAGLVLLAILFGSRLRSRSRRARKAVRRHNVDPVTQPVTIVSLEPASQPRKTRPRRAKAAIKAADAPAYLVRLSPDGEPAPVTPIPLTSPDMTFGTDPVQSTCILDEPVLSPLHARIQQSEAGYAIFDQGSVAGTWVNYELVAREGHSLKHGDKVHFGHLMYRFEMKNPPALNEPTVTPADS
jgi:hypothetical protein